MDKWVDGHRWMGRRMNTWIEVWADRVKERVMNRIGDGMKEWLKIKKKR